MADGIDMLDPRFPIRLTVPERCFWEMIDLRPHRHAADSLVIRAHADAARWQERFVTPITPAVAWDAALHDRDAFEETGTMAAIEAPPARADVPDDTFERIGRIEAIWEEWTRPRHAGGQEPPTQRLVLPAGPDQAPARRRGFAGQLLAAVARVR